MASPLPASQVIGSKDLKALRDRILPTNKHRKLEDALGETQKTRETGDTGLTWLTGPTVVRHDLTEISQQIGKISNSLKFNFLVL